MRVSALRYATKHGYEKVVFASSTSLLNFKAIVQLSDAVTKLEELKKKTHIPIVTPVLGIGSSSVSLKHMTLQNVFTLSKPLLQFAEHPLNFHRTAECIHAIWRNIPMLERLIPSEYGYEPAFPSSVVALSVKSALLLMNSSTNENFLNLGRVSPTRALLHTRLWLCLSAYAVVRDPIGRGGSIEMNEKESNHFDTVELLRNDPNQYQEALVHQQQPLIQRKSIKKWQPSQTLVVATCAGVWHRTLSLILSLEASHKDDFDFMLAVTPRGKDQSDEFARAAGIATIVQPKAVGLTDLWNQVVKLGISEGRKYIFIINNDVLVGDGSVGDSCSCLSAFAPAAMLLL